MLTKILKLGLASLVLISLSLVGCNSDSNSATQSESEAGNSRTHTVVIEQMQYKPNEITVSKGDTIIFDNKDIVAHDVTEKNKAWQSPTLNPGDTWTFVPEESADYFCSIHLVMTGKIIVK